MADEKIVEAAVEETPAAKKATKKASTKAVKAEKVEAKEEAKKVVFAVPTAHDYEVILEPIITEKSMALMQNENKITLKVSDKANKIEIKESFQRLYQAPVEEIKIVNVMGKKKSRGGRYQGTTPGYKKAVITLKKDVAIDLFKE